MIFKDLEEKISESEIKYRTLFEHAADAIVLVDSETGELVEFNNKAYEQLGYTSEEFKKLKIPDFEIIESDEDVKKYLDKILMEGSDTFETKHRTKDGDIRDIYVSSKTLDIRGKKFIQSIWRDVTERKKAEEILCTERDNLINILNSMEDGVYIVDQEYNIEYVNPSLINDFGPYEGKKCHEYTHDRSVPCPWCKMQEILEGKTIRSELFYKKNQKVYDVIETSLIKPDKNITKLKIFRDITERKKAEQKLKESEANYHEAFERAEFYKDLFAHDISNILQNIKSSLALFSMWQNKPEKLDETSKLMNIINDQVIRGVKLVQNVRKLSQISEKEGLLESTEVIQVLNRAIKFIYKSYPDKDLNIEIDSHFKEINVEANELLLDVLENILFNAVKYNENLKIEILTKISKEIKDGIKYIKIEFIDNGIGVPDVMKERIFKGISERKEKIQGMGLGLLLVKKALAIYNGDIWVEDKVQGDPSKGSNFILLIPEVV